MKHIYGCIINIKIYNMHLKNRWGGFFISNRLKCLMLIKQAIKSWSKIR